MIVVDASVAVKWFLDEPGAAEAKDLLVRQAREIAVPDIFLIEVPGALVRQANTSKAKRDRMEAHIARLLHLFEAGSLRAMRLEPEEVGAVAKLALNLGHPLKDCIYLRLAMDLGCPLVTADARFGGKAHGVYGDVRMLGELG